MGLGITTTVSELSAMFTQIMAVTASSNVAMPESIAQLTSEIEQLRKPVRPKRPSVRSLQDDEGYNSGYDTSTSSARGRRGVKHNNKPKTAS